MIGDTGMKAAYRGIAREGFHAAELNLIRNSLVFVVMSIWCCISNTSPFEKFPVDKKLPLMTRMIGGQISSMSNNISAAYTPLSIGLVCLQTATFWQSIIAYLILLEPIFPLEMLGMVLCFIAVVILAMEKNELGEDEEET